MNKLLNENWIDNLPNNVTEHFESLNRQVIAIICKRLKEIGEMSATDVHRLTSSIEFLGADFDKIEKIIAEETGKSRKEIHQMFVDLVTENDNWARVFYEAQGIQPIDITTSLDLQLMTSIIEQQTFNAFVNLSNTTANFLLVGKTPMLFRDAYVNVIDRAIFAAQSGVMSYQQAIRPLVKQFGKGQVVYESGYRRRSDSVFRQIVLDGVRELNQQVMNYHGAQYGADGVEISAHAISAPDHVFVQGHQFSNANYELIQSGIEGQIVADVDGKLYKTFRRNIGEWNCRHFAIPIVIGISGRAYTDEELRDYRFKSKEKYEKTQKMRRMESYIRTLKQERDVYKECGLMDEYRAKRTAITDMTKKYKKYAYENGLEIKPFNLLG